MGSQELVVRWAGVAFASGSVLWASTLSVSAQAPAEEPKVSADQAAFFEAKIRPVLAENCLSCHGAKVQISGLRLDTRAGFLRGTSSGKKLIGMPADQNPLLEVLRYGGKIKMPPTGKLKPAQIADFEAWIAMGAPWPNSSATKEASTGELWSLVPVKKPALPAVKAKTWVRNPIDAFVLAKLESKELAPAAEADRRSLLRRLNYDLIGLPPTAQEVAEFQADKSADAYEKVVDRLLASSHYGERWARHWLDVARYADTKGYTFEEDRNYPNAYTYRNWVINALNRDLPYDQFVIQQIAADRIPAVAEGDDKTPLAAMGFLTLGRRFLNSVPDIIDDRIDVTTRGFQAFTVSCARCHDHKFDPIPTQDYYSLYGIFDSSREETMPISPKPIRDPWSQHQAAVSDLETKIRTTVMGQMARLRKIAADPAQAKALSAEIKGILQGIRPEVTPAGDNLNKLFTVFEPAALESIKSMAPRLDKLRASAPQTPEFAMAMVDNNPHDGVVFKRGNPGNQGENAPRRFLAALQKPGEERTEWKGTSGRLELAKSIASPSNPLTARVFVNRVWHHHFGAGIVRTPSDFGRQGEKPTHPELLDYLAATFVENGWSIKKLHRMIVTSATYRQKSEVPKATLNADPDNRWLARFSRRRLDLEQTRDSLFLASGELDLKQVGGKSVDLWAKPFARRRAVYGFIERQNLPGVFRTFDFASPDSTNARRFQTTVPQQALFLMNSPLTVNQAKVLTARPEIAQAKSPTEQVRQLYRRLLSRSPEPDELEAGLQFLASGPAIVAQPQPVWQYGYGRIDATTQRVQDYRPLEAFRENRYQASDKLPDPALGYLLLNEVGGHPGNDDNHGIIRRWIAPETMTVSITGDLNHPDKNGNGVQARIVSSRLGLLGDWKAFNKIVKTEVPLVMVQKGDVIDFVVTPNGSTSNDGFGWAPTLKKTGSGQLWSANAGFAAPPEAPISRLALFAQALMLTNEFMFVD